MNEKIRFIALTLIMTTVALIIGSVAIGILYNTAFEQKRAGLVETAKSQARLMEAIARFDVEHVRQMHEHKSKSSGYAAGSTAATLSQIIDAHKNYKGWGKTGEFTLARREGEQIVFILRHRQYKTDKPAAIPFHSNLAEPMQLALAGQSGTIIGLDYQGTKVLAAYEPVVILNLGIVAKTNLAEIRAPFIHAFGIVLLIVFITIAAGTLLFFAISNPIIRTIEANEKRFYSITQSANDAIIAADENGIITFWNNGAQKSFGYKTAEVLGKPISILMPNRYKAVHEEHFLRVKVTGNTRLKGKTIEVSGLRKGGEEFPLDIFVTTWVTKGKRVFSAVVRDITERKQIERELQDHRNHLEELVRERTTQLQKANHALKVLTKCRSVIFHANDEVTMLKEICQVLVHDIGYLLAWIGFAVDDINKTVRPVAQVGYKQGYLESVTISWDDNKFGQGPTGTAIRTGEVSFVRNILTDPTYSPWRKQALQYGYASLMVMPLKLQGQSIGVINVYSKQANDFDVDTIQLFRELAADIEYAITVQRNHVKRRQAEESLRRFRAALDNSADAVFIIDRQMMKYVDMNKMACDSTGYTREELLTMGPQDIKPYCTKLQLAARFDDVIRSNHQGIIKTMHHRKDASEFPVEIFVQSLKLDTGYLMVASVRDATERQQAEDALQKERNKLLTILNAIPNGVYIVNKQFEVKYINPVIELTFGPINGRKCYSYFHNRSEVCSWCKNDQVFAGSSIQWEWYSPEQDKYYDAFDIPIQNADGSIAKFKILHDLTKRKRAEIALKQAKEKADAANHAKSEFLANMSHEIRTPMNAILGFTEILSSKVQEPQHKEYLAAINSSGKTLLSLLNDILDLAKVEAGKLELEYIAIEPAKVFHDIGQLFTSQIIEKRLEFIINIAPNMPNALFLDETRLRQILLNLLSNAVKFTDSGFIKLASSWIETTTTQGEFIFTIEDSGKGISTKHQKTVFTAFTQQNGQEHARYGGTGLGLTITHRLIEMMDGTISLKSLPNQGSTFKVRFPQVEIAAPIAKESVAHFALEKFQFKPAKILIVEDIKLNRDLITAYLIPYKTLELFETDNGKDAIKLAEQHYPDLILMDKKMPMMNGYEAAKLIKLHPSLSHIPIIFITASLMKTEKEKLKILCDGFLGKPINRHDLIMEISRFLVHSKVECDKITNQTEVQTEVISFTSEILTKLPELLDILQIEIDAQWQELSQAPLLGINALIIFGERVQTLGDDYNYPPLQNWGNLLQTQAKLFDMNALPITLQKYPNLVDNLTELLNQKYSVRA